MPAMTDKPRGDVQVVLSAPLELMWLIHFLGAGHPHAGAFEGLEPARMRLGPRLAGFWQDGMPQLSTDVVVLAHVSGTLRDGDLARFFTRFGDAAAKDGPLPTLRSESPAEREAVRGRLARLAAEPGLRAGYLELLRDVWAAGEEDWKAEGRQAAGETAAEWSRELKDGDTYKQVLQLRQLWAARPDLDVIADAAASEGRLVLTPCWFGGKIHVIELDGLVYAGKGVRFDESAYRDVAVEISSSIKALADPTRLSILLRLARHPASVTEVARQFDLSQPTVSAHVQILREAGLLEEKAVGRSAMLGASEEGLRRLFSNAQDSLIKLFRD